MTNLDYQNTLDKALSQLRALEIDEALNLLYQLLQQTPNDFSLIDRIYSIEKNRKPANGFKKICLHIFSLESKSQEFHQLIVSAFVDYKSKFEGLLNPKDYSDQLIFNLFFHLGQTGYSNECDVLKTHISHKMAEHKQTPQALYYYSEQLVDKNKLLLAIKELEYLIIYYTEAATTLPAEKLLKQLRERIRQP